MPFEAVGLVLSLALGSGLDVQSLGGLLKSDIVFRPRERAVSNWRREAATQLDATPGTAANILLGRDPAAVTRCVRLNNYWCIKRGGWAGEIAADQDGHVAFASASEGATVAALLLRRYYVDYGRHSARAIVSRWAPASCGVAVASGRGSRATPDGLALRGIGGTLRARWLARHGRRLAAGGALRGRRSAVPDRLIGAPQPAPSIALGLGEAPVSLSASLPLSLSLQPLGSPAPSTRACGDDAIRIASYAVKASAGIAPSPDADLRLFDAGGSPTPHLARLMHNMSAVEIGPLGAGAALIDHAVAHAAEVVAARSATAASAATAGPGATPARRLDEARPPDARP